MTSIAGAKLSTIDARDGGSDQAETRAASSIGVINKHVTFEEYVYSADRARAFESTLVTENTIDQLKKLFTGKKLATQPTELQTDYSSVTPPEKHGSNVARLTTEDGNGVTELEWERAQRATRTATWITVFYLITTDILGPYNVPWAVSRMGYGPGVALYTVFGGFAFYSGLQLWKQFCGLDSPRYPMRNYGDLGFRIFGNWARMVINVLQSCQFFLNVTLITVSNGQGLQQMAAGASGKGFLCFVVAEVIFMLLGFVLGQIRTLQRLGFLANIAVWLNIFVIFMTMGVTSVFKPNYEAAQASYGVAPGPVQTSANWPEGSKLIDRVNGLMNGVFAYGGATLFTELMAEMRRPNDFYKSLICAEIFIFSMYITIGMVVYTYQGQFTFNPAYQGIPNSAYAWQTVGNAIAFVSALIAAVLYGNIGVKVLYASVLRDVFHFPALDTKKGKLVWMVLVPIYWALAFIFAAAIPQLSNLAAFVGAAFILQFSYTFPPILMVGFNCQKDAVLPEELDTTVGGRFVRVDSGPQRWIRGYRKQWLLNTFNVIYFVASLAVAGLGIYASILGMRASFKSTPLTPFTCGSPTG
ncbi:unnamed protein product [Zymoseptoria tritici ST99CH_1A5]|uniref:Amino acid transporter transmembrane domain-containing protein n=1 Tax=Zymoseptoria tritici ST99CH_1A5 TaxID=1276529 RepID=A0A1Y6L954_ZYMTR|nr:unnamed protein product [Zymoseptoria tritici ST99CH_1A5]